MYIRSAKPYPAVEDAYHITESGWPRHTNCNCGVRIAVLQFHFFGIAEITVFEVVNLTIVTEF